MGKMCFIECHENESLLGGMGGIYIRYSRVEPHWSAFWSNYIDLWSLEKCIAYSLRIFSKLLLKNKSSFSLLVQVTEKSVFLNCSELFWGMCMCVCSCVRVCISVLSRTSGNECSGFFVFAFLNYFIYLFSFGWAGTLLLRRLFSSCSKQGLLSSCGVQASHCSGFSHCGTWALGPSGFSSCHTWAQ